MYMNQFEITGTPEFYSKGTEGLGEFYYIDSIMVFFPYPKGKHEINLPKKGETLLPITAKCTFHSEEYDETIDCYGCEESFEKKLGIAYLIVSSYGLQERVVSVNA